MAASCWLQEKRLAYEISHGGNDDHGNSALLSTSLSFWQSEAAFGWRLRSGHSRRRDSLAMRPLVTAVAALACLAHPAELRAQSVGADAGVSEARESMPLSAAIAELRRGRFHTGTSRLADGTASPYQLTRAFVPGFGVGLQRYQQAPPDTLASSARLFATTAGVGLLAYPVGAVVTLYSCGSAPPTSSCVLQLALGMSVPVAALGVTARALGADPGRAALGSLLGGALGLAVWAADLNQPLVSFGLATVAHAAVTTLAARIHFRTRPRS